MNSDYLTESTVASTDPWLIIAVILIAIVSAGLLYLLNRLNTVRAERNKGMQVLDQYIADNAILNERLTAKNSELTRLEKNLGDQLKERIAERDNAREKTEEYRQVNNDLESSLAARQATLSEERKSSQEKIQLLEQAEQRLTKEFENLANRIFEEKHEKFSKASKASIETILNPFQAQLKEFRERVDNVYDKESKDRVSLLEQVKHLKELNEKISEDAINLTNALKGESKTRGSWGEVQLERILEESGLKRGREYEIQGSFKNEDGERLQPDVVVHLPESKDVVIDSKVSLAAYDRYYAASTDEDRDKEIKAHIASIRTHIKGLSSKNYGDLTGIKSLDLVLMFVPIEPALLLAFEHENSLYNEAFNKGILLVSPTTLMGTLQIIQNIWRYEYQNRNAMEIAQQAGNLHDQFVLFIEALEDVGKHIEKAEKSYQTAHKRLTSGKGNLVNRTVKLEKLGAKTKKQIPQALQDYANESDTDETQDAGTALPEINIEESTEL